MKKFIEVHDAEDSSNVLIAIDAIRGIIEENHQPSQTCRARIIFEDLPSVGHNGAVVHTIESFEEIKKKLLASGDCTFS